MQPDKASRAADGIAIADLLRGNAASLEKVESQAKQGNRVAALACGYWHQARDAATAVSYIRQAAEAGNSAAAALCSWRVDGRLLVAAAGYAVFGFRVSGSCR